MQAGFGLADAKQKRAMPLDAIWDWASVTKQFTAAAILKLEMLGKLRLDDPLSKYFASTPPDKKSVTLRHLLNHTSGIQTGPKAQPAIDFRNRDATVDLYLRLPVLAKPGREWAYSNLAYAVLAAVVERASGRTYERFCIKQLFRPAGMKSACFIGSPGLKLEQVPLDARGTGVHFAYGDRLTWGYRGAGGAVVPLREMLTWDRALRGTKVLSKRAKKKLYTVGLDDYALGWYVKKRDGDMHYYHSGAVGKTVCYFLRTEKSQVVVALSYSYQPNDHPESVARRLARIAAKAK